MQVVRDLHPDGHGMRLAFVIGGGHAHDPAGRSVRHARDQSASTRQRQAGFRVSKAHRRQRLGARHEAASVNHYFAAGNRRCGRDSLNARTAVFFYRSAQAKFHITLKCNATCSTIAA